MVVFLHHSTRPTWQRLTKSFRKGPVAADRHFLRMLPLQANVPAVPIR